MTLVELLRAHVAALEARGYAPSTVRARQLHLARFTAWCGERGVEEGRDLTPAVLERYQHVLATGERGGRALGTTSQIHSITSIRLMLSWAVRTHRLLVNAAAELTLPRLPRRLPRAVLSVEEAELVLQQPDLATPLGLRDRAILEVLYSTGIRRMELIGLDLPDVDRARGIVFVREGKGRKDRLVPVGARAVRWVEQYLARGRPSCVRRGGGVEALFLSARGRRITPGRLTERLHGYLVAAGIEKPGSCHVWRHTAATLMHEGGADIRDVQEMLGHAQLSTTQIYTHVSVERLKAVHARTHPARLERAE